MLQPWDSPAIRQHSLLLLHSFHHYLGRPLLPTLAAARPALAADPEAAEKHQAQQLFAAPFVVVSHGTEAVPIFNYGNAKALALWELNWEAFTQLPSRKSARGAERPERAEMLAQAKKQGYFEGYVGDHATSSGKRFRMEDGIIWTVINAAGEVQGQAATFSRYHFL